MNTGEALTRWTVRVAVLCMIATWVLLLGKRGRNDVHHWARVIWTAGYIAFLLHLYCAFEFFHHWSHEAAYRETARQTKEAVGLDWGGGVYANDVFAIVWGLDVAWWWRTSVKGRTRPRLYSVLVHGFLAFIALNATVVFATGIARWIGVAGCVTLALAAWKSRR